MRRTADIGCLSVLPFFETITIIPFSTVTRRTPDMSRTNCSPSRMTSTSRGLGAGGAGIAAGDVVAGSAAAAGGGVPVLLAVLEFLLRGARGTRTGRARSGFGVGVFSAASVSFRSLLAAASVSVLPSFAFPASARSASSPEPGLGGLLRAVSAREFPRLPVPVRAGRGLAGDFFATTGGGGSGVSSIFSASSLTATSTTGSSIRAPVDVTRLTFLSALLAGVGSGD